MGYFDDPLDYMRPPLVRYDDAPRRPVTRPDPVTPSSPPARPASRSAASPVASQRKRRAPRRYERVSSHCRRGHRVTGANRNTKMGCRLCGRARKYFIMRDIKPTEADILARLDFYAQRYPDDDAVIAAGMRPDRSARRSSGEKIVG